MPRLSGDVTSVYQTLGKEVARNVEQYYKIWRLPMPYKTLIPRFHSRLPKGTTLMDFVAWLDSHQYVSFLMTPRGRQYVFPFKRVSEADDEEVISILMEIDRRQDELSRASDRRRKANR